MTSTNKTDKQEYPFIFTILDKTNKSVVYTATYFKVEGIGQQAKRISCQEWFRLYGNNTHVKPPLTIE